ncbi:PIR protein [Plasmodium vivax]|nr:PIR protein [Plasmodium vivax]
MQGQRRTNNGILHTIRAFEQLKCISNYSKLKSEIEKEIDVFNQKKLNDFYKEWNKININITQKNNEIKDCVNKGHVSVDLINLDNVKNFRERCLNPKASTCRNSSPSQVRKSPELKRSGAGDSCKPGKNCKEGIAQSKEERGKSQSRALEEGSKTIGTPRTDPKHESQNNPIGQEPGNTNIIPQLQPSVAHSDSQVVAEVKVPEQRDNGDSTLSSREKAQGQLLPILEPSQEDAFKNSPVDQPLRPATDVETDRGDASQLRGSEENTPQSETPREETVGANTTGLQSNVATIPPRTDADDHGVTPSTYASDSDAEEVSLNQNQAHKDSISVSTDDLRSVSSNPFTIIDHYTGSVTTNSESSPVEALSSKREDSELVTSTGYVLDKVHKFFDAIPNKEHVIKASAPMGIVLLLGLLFKYTPLWRVLTKKNRKKGAVINEELNSVLQEPSIMDDERSIPFSYGAFEYSTFDQNVY